MKTGKNLRIIFIEDSDTDIDLIHYELNRSKISYSFEIAKTKQAYEEILDKFIPDIILSDYSLPTFDGVTAFDIKQTKCPEIPFIIITGTIGEENAVELIKKGINDYVLKDKLFTLAFKIDRALEDAKILSEKRTSDDILKKQYEKLYEIAMLQSHQVRSPIAAILGLIDLFDCKNPSAPINSEVIQNLQKTTVAFDKIIHMIVQKTNDINRNFKKLV